MQVRARGIQGDVIHKAGGPFASVRTEGAVVHNPQAVILVEISLLIGSSDLKVVNSLHIRQIRPQASIRKRPILSHRLLLNWREIVELVATRIIVVLISADKSAQSEHRVLLSIRVQPVRY